MSRARRAFALSAAVLAVPASALAAPAAAPDPVEDAPIDPELAELLDEPIASTASKRSEPISAAPATVFTITAEEMRLHGLRTVEEAIAYLGNSMVVNAPYGDMSARGLALDDDGNHFLLLVNGHVRNNVWGGWQRTNRQLGVPLEMIERVEISLGPGSVLYGTSAMFGVINVVTKQPAANEGIHASVTGAVSPPVGEGGQLRTVGNGYQAGHDARVSFGWAVPFSALRRGGGWSFQVEAYDGADPSTHFGPQEATYDPGLYVARPGVWGGISRRKNRGVGGLTSLRLGRFEIDLGANVDDQYDPFEYDTDFGDPGNHTVNLRMFADVRHFADLGKHVQLKSRAYADGGRWDANWIYSDPAWCPGLSSRCRNTELIREARAGVEEQVTVDWLLDGRLVTLAGADGRANWLADRVGLTEISTGRRTPYELLDSNRVTGAGALYIEQSWWPVERIALDGGVRFDIDQTFGWHLSPRAAITVLPWRLANIKLLFSEAFRAPGIGELEYRDPLSYLKADGLDAEVVRSLELTGEQRFPGGRGSVRVGGFYSWWRDLIGLGPISQDRFERAIADGDLNPDADPAYVVQYQNHGRIQSFGGFAALQAHTLERDIQFGVNVGVAQAMDREGYRVTRPLALYPTFMGNARLAWVPPDPIPSLGVAAFYNSRKRTYEDVNGAFTNPLRSPHHVQWRATLDGAVPRTHGLRYGVTFDHSFTRHGAYLVGPNRSSDTPAWRGELYPLSQLTVIGSLRYDFSLVKAKERRRERQRPAARPQP